MEAGTATEQAQETQVAQTTESTATEATSQEATATPSAPDLAEQVADALQRRQNENQAETPAPSLCDALQPVEEQSDDTLTAEDIAVLQQFGLDPNAAGGQATEATQQEAIADPRVDSLVAEVEQLTEREVNRELNAIETDYPDIREPQVFNALQQKLAPLAQEYGEKVKTNPVLIRTLYKAVKAEMADAAATPAEKVDADAASLETSAGRSQQGGSDLSEQLADTLIGARGSGTAFTR